MVSQIFSDALVSVYHGEQFGEAVFEALLPKAQNEEQRYILGSLLQLESVGKAVCLPSLACRWTKIRTQGQEAWQVPSR